MDKVDLTAKEFATCRTWIQQKRRCEKKTWECINDLCLDDLKDDADLSTMLQCKKRMDGWPSITPDDWRLLVQLAKKVEEESFTLTKTEAIITKEKNTGIFSPNDADSWPTWQDYKSHLRQKGFPENSIDVMESTTIKILEQLKSSTEPGEPVKGMVIGNVQSGKTANMEALMCMAADWGWNLFIILSGTIEALRVQTQARMFNDLKNNSSGRLNWLGLEHLAANSTGMNDIKNVDFSNNSADRYFTVCLKNSSRLKELLKWLYKIDAKTKNMRILVIDDEADQASVNTADISKKERTTINRLISNLVHGKTSTGRGPKASFTAMNYIGYTATPYANVLNQGPSATSLYPEDFIVSLVPANEYFGPQQIFGSSDGEYEGLDIVRIIDSEELEKIKRIHEMPFSKIPAGLQESLCWFICCVAVQRLRKYKNPVSMLIHTSHKVDSHENLYNSIGQWFKKNRNTLLPFCEQVWKKETARFSLQKFREQFPDYGKIKELLPYPAFEEIEPEIRNILTHGLRSIRFSETQNPQYSQGLHFCIDNYRYNKIIDGENYLRLLYPDQPLKDINAPAFIVIGGNTLSRGLTLEGLVSTYFLRVVGQADTLMQMGRWFGYRKGYELLPRLWLTEKTDKQFKFLADLDSDLRDEIYQREQENATPASYGPKIMNTPKKQFLKITSKNKMQSAIEADVDYTGTMRQTTIFPSDDKKQKENLKLLQNMTGDLGTPEKKKAAYLWKGIDSQKIIQFLKSYHFSERAMSFADIDMLVKWVEEISVQHQISPWNVILAGKKSSEKASEKYAFQYGEINKINRSRLKNSGQDISIGVLSNNADLLLDIDEKAIGKRINKNSRQADIRSIRSENKVGQIPQLVLYVIDKNSTVSDGRSETRENLNAANDLAGFVLYMPGLSAAGNCAKKLHIRLNQTIFDDEGDLENENEN